MRVYGATDGPKAVISTAASIHELNTTTEDPSISNTEPVVAGWGGVCAFCTDTGGEVLWRTCVDGSGNCEIIMVISHGTRSARRFRWTAPRKLRRSIRWPRGDAMGIINSVRCGVNAHIRGPAIETTDCPPNASDE